MESTTPSLKLPWEEIFASLGDGLVVLDPQRRLIGVNPAAEQIMGRSAEAILGLTLPEIGEFNHEVLNLLEPAFQEGRALTLRHVPWKIHYGGVAIVDLSVTLLLDEEGELSGWVLVFRDLTPLKDMEEEVRKADRLAMMGTIASGLAHEIKNPLGGIKGAAQLLSREQVSEESRECLNIIVKEADRVNRLVGELLSFTKPRKSLFEPLNLNELLDAIVELHRGVFDEKSIHVSLEFDPSLPSVMGDPDQLRQAFLNFVKNAIEAVGEGKEIRVRSRLVTDFKIGGSKGQKATRMVMVEIQDQGVGISEEDLQKIFTPFFTTKNTGSGLGLAICQRIIHEHGGSVKMNSEKGKGTTVQVFLRCSI